MQCSNVPKLAALYIVSYASTTVFSVLLIRFTDGAVFTVIVMALVTPLSTLFWNLFSATPQFHWEPFFDPATILLLLGLCIMMPAVILYTYFGTEAAGAPSDHSKEVVHEEPPTEPAPTAKRTRLTSLPASKPPKEAQRFQRTRAQTISPKVVPYKPDEVPLRYRTEVPPRKYLSRSASASFLPPIRDEEKKRQRKLKSLQESLNRSHRKQIKRVKSAPVLMGGF